MIKYAFLKYNLPIKLLEVEPHQSIIKRKRKIWHKSYEVVL